MKRFLLFLGGLIIIATLGLSSHYSLLRGKMNPTKIKKFNPLQKAFSKEFVEEEEEQMPIPGSAISVKPKVSNKTTAQDNQLQPLQSQQVAPQDRVASQAKYMEGLEAYNQGDYEVARKAWTEAQQLDPSSPDAKMALEKVKEMLEKQK